MEVRNSRRACHRMETICTMSASQSVCQAGTATPSHTPKVFTSYLCQLHRDVWCGKSIGSRSGLRTHLDATVRAQVFDGLWGRMVWVHMLLFNKELRLGASCNWGLTPYLAPAERVYFNQILPEEKIDEALFTSSRSPGNQFQDVWAVLWCAVKCCEAIARLHWASGHHPSDFCPSTAAMVDGQRAVIDGPLSCSLGFVQCMPFCLGDIGR